MQCTAILASGQPCSREPERNSSTCRLHGRLSTGSEFYSARLTQEEQRALAAAADLVGLNAEIAVLRVLIRRVAGWGDIEGARRAIDALCRTLRTRHELGEGAEGRLATTLERVLDTLDEELAS